MPIYEYRCESCAYELEMLQRMSDDKLVDCPACDEPELRRLVSAAAFRLKGNGWYETDFKNDNKRNLAGSVSEFANMDGTGKKSDKSSITGNGAKMDDKKPATKPATTSGKGTSDKASAT